MKEVRGITISPNLTITIDEVEYPAKVTNSSTLRVFGGPRGSMRGGIMGGCPCRQGLMETLGT